MADEKKCFEVVVNWVKSVWFSIPPTDEETFNWEYEIQINKK